MILSNVSITGDRGPVGAVAGTVGGNSQIENCYISGSLATTGSVAAGGLIGQVQSGRWKFKIVLLMQILKTKVIIRGIFSWRFGWFWFKWK